MIIIVDKEGRKAVEEMCDVALKAGGLANLKGIQQVFMALKQLKEPEQTPAEDSKDEPKDKDGPKDGKDKEESKEQPEDQTGEVPKC